MTARLLPPGFDALEPFAAVWAGPTPDARLRRRLDSTEAERSEFYAVASSELPRAMAHLDACPLDGLDDAEQRLFDLMLTLAQVSLAVERQREHEATHAVDHRHFTFTRT